MPAELEQDHFGFTPLHYAAENGDLQAVRALLQAGAFVNAANRSGYTALHYAVCIGSAELVQLLLNAGADPASRLTQGNFSGWTPLGFAVSYGHQAIVEILRPLSPLDPTIQLGQHELQGEYAADNYDPPRETRPFRRVPIVRCFNCHERLLYETGAIWDGTDWHADCTCYFDCANCNAECYGVWGGYAGHYRNLQPRQGKQLLLWRKYAHMPGT